MEALDGLDLITTQLGMDLVEVMEMAMVMEVAMVMAEGVEMANLVL